MKRTPKIVRLSTKIYFDGYVFNFERDDRTDTWVVSARKDDGNYGARRRVARLHKGRGVEVLAADFDQKRLMSATSVSAVFFNWEGYPQREPARDDSDIPF